MSVQAATPEEIDNALQALDGWSVEDGKLHRDLEFEDFVAAFGFMTRVALVAETLQHHPEWRNVWNRVSIDLTTHDAGNQISAKDFELAAKIDGLVAG